MISLKEYVTENFIANDLEISKLEPNMQQVPMLRALVKKYNDLGEEDFEGDNPYDRLLNRIESMGKTKNIPSTYNAYRDITKAEESGDEAAIKAAKKAYEKIRIQKANKMFDLCLADAKKDARRWQSEISPNDLLFALIGVADYIDHHSALNDDVADKLLGKLITKFDTVLGLKNSAINTKYSTMKTKFIQNIAKHDAEVNNLKEVQEEAHNHKYTIMADSTDSAAQFYIFDNEKFQNFDDMVAYINKINRHYVEFDKYDYKRILNYAFNNKSQVPSLTLCASVYTFNKENPDKDQVPTFGFLDELPTKVYAFSNGLFGDNKVRYRGKVREDAEGVWEWGTSLWTVHGKEED